jgi:hypothetical protein
LAFTAITILTGAAALFIVEAMASIAGNECFQASIEYTTIAELFLGHRWQWALQAVLYLALQSQTIASLIESFQVTWRLSCVLLLSALIHHAFRVWMLFS